MKKFLLFYSVFMFVLFGSYAQERTVSGKITSSEDGSTLPGVNVVLKGTTNGTISDADGNFQLNVPSEGGTLVFSFVGLQTQEVEIGSSSIIDLAMSADVTQLSEVVVTAQGISRDKKSLGYAVSTVKSEDLEQKAEGDIARVLRGKASGVNITQTSGVAGSGTNIIIRGFTSINGSNQPLFIVDGVPFDGGTNTSNNFVDGQTESSRFLDLDPNNIENVSVLKGLSATVLYGEKGRNGVILITTKNSGAKKGGQKTEITFSQSYFKNEIASLPDYQQSYGGGFYQNFGFFFSNWGPHFDEIDSVGHPYGRFSNDDLQAAFSEYEGTNYAYKPYDNVGKFFRKGTTATTSLSIRGGNEKASFNANYSYMKDEGFTVNNDVERNNFGFGGNAKLANKFTLGASFNFTLTEYRTPPIAASLGSGTTGSGSSIFGDVFYTPRSVDLNGLPYQNPLTGGSVYYRSGNDIQNPRWTLENAGTTQSVNRFYGNTFLQYDINDWMNVMYRVGLDTYSENNTNFQNRGGVDGNILGSLRTIDVTNTIWDHSLILSLQKDLSSDFNLRANIGVNARQDNYSRNGILSTDQVVYGTLKHWNFREHDQGNIQYQNLKENLVGVYAVGELAFRNYLYVTLQGRRDVKNTVESGNQSIFYPGASVAFDATSAIGALQNSSILNYLKLRLGYGSSAGYPPAFSTRNTLGLNPKAYVNGTTTVTTNTVSNRLGNPDLKPERVSEIEFGIESSLLNDRLGINLSVYKKNTTDLLLDRSLDPATGYTVMRQNAGELEVKGLEIDVTATVIKKGAFAWNLGGNFFSDKSLVVSLPEGTDKIAVAGFTNLGNFAIPGEQLNVILGSYVVTDDAGNRMVDSEGLYVVSNDEKIIGTPNPKFVTNINNTFTYKGISLGFDIMYRQGGDIYSRTASTLIGRGITTDVDLDRSQSFILPGVDSEGNPNTKQIAATDYYWNVLGFGAEEFKVWDGTTIRLNEISLGYSLPSSLLEKTPFGSVSFTFRGTNLWYDAVNMPDGINFDTNVLGTGVGNGQGMDFLSGPSKKTYGASLKLTF